MHARLVRLGCAAATLALAALPAGAQQPAPSTGAGLHIAPYAGYISFGDYLEGPLGTSLTSAGAAVYGAQAGVRLTRNVAVYGNVAHANADLQVGVPILGGLDIGSSSVWLYDGGVELSAGARASGLPVTPFVQLGAGAIRHDLQSSRLTTNATNWAFNAGVGADVALAPNVGLRLMAKDYMGRFDTKEASGLGVEGEFAHNWAVSGGVRLSF